MNREETGDVRARIWARLWSAGVPHSCGRASGQTYDGRFARFWNERFSQLPDGAMILDVGTGNGAVPLLAKSAATTMGRTFRIHGVDLAPIDPVAAVADGPSRYVGITFHPRTALEALPFPDAQVDLLCSHYAFEYAAREEALNEVIRVIGPNGRAGFILHSRDSVVYATALEQLRSCQFLFEESPLLAMLPLTVQALAEGRSAADHPATGPLHQAMEGLQRRLDQPYATDILHKAAEIVEIALREAPRHSPRVTLEWLDHAISGLADERHRLEALRAAALDESSARALCNAFLAAGYRKCELDLLHHDGGKLMGWSLVVGQ